MIKTGVIGYGFSARTFHLPFIQWSTDFELAAISSSRAGEQKSSLQDACLFESPQELIANGKAELVVITAPNHAHFPLAKQCLEHGLNVILEKPMTCSLAEAQELAELAANKSLLLSVYHNRRWDGDFLTVQKLIKSGAVGEVKFFKSHFDRFRPNVRDRWREQPGPGSGFWLDLGSHLVDQALCLFGLPKALTARCLPLRKSSKAIDFFHVMLHYDNLEVVLHASPFCAAPNFRFRLEGTGGTYAKYGLDPQEDQLKQGMTPSSPGYGLEPEDSYGKLYTESSSDPIATLPGCYQNFYQAIHNAIKNNGITPVSPEDGVKAMRILEVAEESCVMGKTLRL